MPKLKVYRTPIGFHDAYVAAPSMKAALKAWGTTKNLFSRGAAELVTDAKLTKEPLARPGEVIKLARGSAAEHRKAVGSSDRAASNGKTAPEPKPAKRRPRPNRKPLEKTEQALSAGRQRHGRIGARRRFGRMVRGRFGPRRIGCLMQLHQGILLCGMKGRRMGADALPAYRRECTRTSRKFTGSASAFARGRNEGAGTGRAS